VTFTIKPRPRRDGVTLESEALSFPMWYGNADDAAGYAKFRAGSARATIEVFDARGELVQRIEHDPNMSLENSGRLGAL
jgi:hypothetical protein